jgi:hypothetical protein
VSSSDRDREEIGNDLLAARERDLKPLLEESDATLDLDHDQVEAMEDFMDQAWFSGLRAGQKQLDARATQRNPDIRAIAVHHFKADVKDLMEQSAIALELELQETINVWSFLHQAWMAGNRSGEAELMALYLESRSDVTAEAQRWLEGEEESKS